MADVRFIVKVVDVVVVLVGKIHRPSQASSSSDGHVAVVIADNDAGDALEGH